MTGSRRELIYWLCQIVGWTLFVCFGLAFMLIYAPGLPFWKFVVVYAIAGGLAVVCTHFYRKFLRRHAWVKLSPTRALPRAIAASAVVGAAIVFIDAWSYFPVFGAQFVVSDHGRWIFPALYSWISGVFGWSVIYFTVHYFRQYRDADVENLRLAVAAKDAELHALLSQLNPHFVFNCLNSVRALIAEDPERAQVMITELSDFLRYSLRSGRRATVPLSEEIEAVSAYLKLETIRFEERLRVEIDAAPDTLGVQVPSMIVQTLVENGVKHGIARLPAGGVIQINASLNDGALHLRVVNSGRLSHDGNANRVGLDNARERLRLLYGPAAYLTLREDASRCVIAEVSIPTAVHQQRMYESVDHRR